jgi:hypothetical protein
MASSAQHTFSASAENLLEIIIKNVSNVRNFSTKNKDAIGDSVDELRRIITEANGRINELENHVCTKVPTYAEVMSLSPPLNKIKTTHVVTIHPTDVTQINSNTTKSLIMQTVNPCELKVRINKLRNIGRGGVIIECSTKEECEKIIRKVDEKLKGKMDAKIPQKRRPKLIIKNIPGEVNDEDLLQTISKQNPNINEITLREEMKLIRTLKTRVGTKHAIIEVSPVLWNTFNNFNFLYILFSRCKVEEYNHVIRCFKCQGYGHFARDCNLKDMCVNCGEEHKTKNCQTPDHNNCVNCKRYNERVKAPLSRTNIKHKANDQCCPSYQRVNNIIKSKIDYGN